MVRLIYTKTTSGKRPKKSKRKSLAVAEEAHEKFLRKMGVPRVTHRSKPIENSVPFPDLGTRKVGVAPAGDRIPGGVVPKKDVLHDHLWKKGSEESPETTAEIARKAANIGPSYHKGGLVYNYDKPIDRKKQ